jgi:hypothetical protein
MPAQGSNPWLSAATDKPRQSRVMAGTAGSITAIIPEACRAAGPGTGKGMARHPVIDTAAVVLLGAAAALLSAAIAAAWPAWTVAMAAAVTGVTGGWLLAGAHARTRACEPDRSGNVS